MTAIKMDLIDLCRRLKVGMMTNEHSPQTVASVIEDLSLDLSHANARIRELETVCLPSVQIAERNGYAKGFRAGTMAAAQMERDPEVADAIVALRRAVLGSYELGAETWLTESDDGHADLLHGDMVFFEAALVVPVPDAIKPIGATELLGTPLSKPSSIGHTGIFGVAPIYGWTGLLYGGGHAYGGGKVAVC